MLLISVGIPAYNEAENIGRLLRRLGEQRLKQVEIKEILVIASGCTDQTVPVVRRWQKRDRRIRLIEQAERKGKTAADNVFIKEAKTDLLVLHGADTLPAKDCLEKLGAVFADPKVGVVAPRIIPLNDPASSAGYFSHLWWQLFDQVAVRHFRAGEIIAFRKVVDKIDERIGSDEVYLTDAILNKGYQARYVREAVAYNMGPNNVKELLAMRRRHNYLTYQVGAVTKQYFPKTMDNGLVLQLFFKAVNWHLPKEAYFALVSAGLEAISRLLAKWDWVRDQGQYLVWQAGRSTKKLLM